MLTQASLRLSCWVAESVISMVARTLPAGVSPNEAVSAKEKGEDNGKRGALGAAHFRVGC